VWEALLQPFPWVAEFVRIRAGARPNSHEFGYEPEPGNRTPGNKGSADGNERRRVFPEQGSHLPKRKGRQPSANRKAGKGSLLGISAAGGSLSQLANKTVLGYRPRHPHCRRSSQLRLPVGALKFRGYYSGTLHEDDTIHLAKTLPSDRAADPTGPGI